jgi:hypothetical protein
MGGRCTGGEFRPAVARPTMRLRGPGFEVRVPRDATRQQLLRQVRRGGRPARQLLFADQPMPNGARLWHDLGMRDDAAFEVDAECDHARLGLEDDACYRCADCGVHAPVAFRAVGRHNVTVLERPPEAAALVEAWKSAPGSGCRHPAYTTELRPVPGRYRATRWASTCVKCGRSADAVRALTMRLIDEREAR